MLNDMYNAANRQRKARMDVAFSHMERFCGGRT